MFGSGFKEAVANELTLDEDPLIMAAVIEFCYTERYQPGPLYSIEQFHVKVKVRIDLQGSS